ncbi:hypothetical protein NC653_032383 [Populus alba x Populus x berolinensis]|uniref:Uncharacterized protein n=1 Tax=Populus alba x Populus x berolinensis TaxID=444605 RepID=A0AAD6LU67_9ROSI|nr:hypothetical protein NC653_032383 [Populus alba x Populus x berolinensis]
MDFFSNCDASVGLIYGMCYLMRWTVFCISSNDEGEVFSMLVLLQQGLPAVIHFGILAFCLSFCYLKLWPNHVAISNTEFCIMVWVKIAFGNMLDLIVDLSSVLRGATVLQSLWPFGRVCSSACFLFLYQGIWSGLLLLCPIELGTLNVE